jgi:GrpB-like predicted nucleotidyltransferase (UPF0157 family)
MLIQKYKKQWPNDFKQIKEVIEKNVSTDDIEIEHIGSTSVKGLAAKPIIDINVVFEKPESFSEIKMSLEKLGYYHNGDQGIEGREVFKRNKQGENHIILDAIKHHLYVCHKNSEELRRHLVFRDYLRKNEEKRIEYEALKYKIAQLTNQDRKEYANLKEVMAKDFVESIIKNATK